MPAISPSHIKAPGGGGGVVYPAGGTPGQSLVWVGPGPNDVAWATVNSIYANVGAIFDGDTNLLIAGSYVDIPVPYPCTILQSEILVQPAGTVSVKVEKATYAAYPTMTLISASAPIASGGAAKNVDSVLTGWTTALLAGDILRFTILSGVVSAKKATAFLKVQK